MRALEAKAGAVLERLPGPVLAADSDGRIVVANHAVCALLDCDRTALVGARLDSIVPERFAAVDDRPLHQWLGAPAQDHRALRMALLRHDGLEIEVDAASALTSDDPALLVVLLSTIHDEGEAKERNARHRLIFEHAPLGIFHFDQHGIITECNDVFVGIIGSTRSTLVGLNMLTLPDENMVRQIRAALAGDFSSYEGEYRSATADKVTPVRVMFAPVIEGEEITGGVGIVQDVTKAKAMQERLARADRLASLGTLAAGVAHEINNPLTYIMANLQACLRICRQKGAAPRDRLEGLLKDALEGAERVRQIVFDLRIFSRAEENPRAPVDIHAVLDAAINLCSSEIKHRARLIKEYGSVPATWADEVRLGQVFVNLLVNAAHAFPEGDRERAWIRIRTGSAPDGQLWVEVADNGKGIPPELVDRVFEPFVTTKPVGVGTGLGLSICHGIVTSLGGDIAIDSVVARGTTIRVSLPVSRAAAAPPDPKPAAKAMPACRILVVDDEGRVARAIAAELGERHEVVSVTSGEDALAQLREGTAFDLILCDVMMPGTGGLEVYAAAQALRPEVADRFAFMTGGVLSPETHQRLVATGRPRLDKPFSRERVDELLAAYSAHSHEST